MSDSNVTVVALLRAKKEQIDALRDELKGLIETTRAEPGCINYDLHESPDSPGLFMFHENWTSKQHLEDHLARPHLKAFLEKADALLAEPVQITLWKKVA